MGFIDWIRNLMRRHPARADAIFAATLLLVGIIEQNFAPLDSLPALLALMGATLPLVLRHRFPFLSTAAIFSAASVLQMQNGVPAAAQVGSLLGLYTLGTLHPTRKAITLQLLALAPFLLTVLISMAIAPNSQFTVIIVLALFAGVTVTASELSKSRRSAQVALEQRAHELETAQRELLRLAIEDERAAIARELHDIVAHNVSVMVLQAGAARRVINTRPDLAIEALTAIDEAGRTALTEMRLVVGVLRPGAEQGREPQPVLSRLGDLISRVEEAGVPVHLVIEGETVQLPVALELSAYRIIQESLTNSMQHGGPDVTSQVMLRYTETTLDITVTDDGRATKDQTTTGGHGLVGIAERVAMFKGRFESGFQPGGGYRVDVSLPLVESR